MGLLAANDSVVDVGEVPTDLTPYLTKSAGLLLTSLAISLGAPFWLDLLSLVSNIRGTGRPRRFSETYEV